MRPAFVALRSLAFATSLVAAGAWAKPGLQVVTDEEITAPQPGIGGDAVLPAGFQELRWGASAEVLTAVRGGMERRPVSESDVTVLIEAPAPGDPRADIIHYKLWRDQLIELRIYYQDRLVGGDAHQFVRRVQDAYGDGDHIVKRNPYQGGGQPEILEESWQWEDPFTIQVLIREPQTNEWSMVRRSKVLEARQVRTVAKERETNADHRVNQIPID